MSSQINRSFFGAFALGFVAATALRLWDKKKANDEDRQNSGARPEGDDCSLFWGDKKELTTILDHRKFLDKEFYGKMVRDCIICCVDCLIVRYNSHLQREEVLLVERGTHPAKGIWWLPGGRLFKGETFFDGAKRKARDETGLSEVTPIQVLGFCKSSIYNMQYTISASIYTHVLYSQTIHFSPRLNGILKTKRELKQFNLSCTSRSKAAQKFYLIEQARGTVGYHCNLK